MKCKQLTRVCIHKCVCEREGGGERGRGETSIRCLEIGDCSYLGDWNLLFLWQYRSGEGCPPIVWRQSVSRRVCCGGFHCCIFNLESLPQLECFLIYNNNYYLTVPYFDVSLCVILQHCLFALLMTHLCWMWIVSMLKLKSAALVWPWSAISLIYLDLEWTVSVSIGLLCIQVQIYN